jgi:glycolate oxidase FAD binding subunit
MGEQALDELRDRIRAANAARAPLRIHGGSTKDFYGQQLAGEPLDTRGWSGIVSFEPTELVVTARCGTPLSELQAALAEQRQMLAFEPPAFGPAASIGGVVAAGLSGPRRASAGSVRDFVLGASLVDAEGELKRFGGQVMKNVAGYDISRLLCGSLGILGLIAEVSLKVLPLPAAERTLALEIGQADALQQLNRWAGQPLPISASAWLDGRLSIRLSGAGAAVDAACSRFERDYSATLVEPAEAARFWSALREHQLTFFEGDAPLWRLSLPSTAAVFALEGPQLLEWGGALRWLRSRADALEVRRFAAAAGGSATLFRASDRSSGVFDDLSPMLAALHRRIKAQFDPNGIFNPGRMYPEL